MAYEKLYQLVDRIIEKTNAGELTWKDTALEDVYEASLFEASIRIRRAGNFFDGQETYFIELLNGEGVSVENINDEGLNENSGNFGRTAEYYGKLKGVFEIAMRKSLGVEDLIDNVLADLKLADDIPF